MLKEFLTDPVIPVFVYALTIAVVLFIGIYIGKRREDSYWEYVLHELGQDENLKDFLEMENSETSDKYFK